MKILFYTIAPIVSSCFILFSCSGNRLGDADQSKDPIVTVMEETLYRGDLDGLIQHGMSPEDSIIATQTYTAMWVNDRLMYDKARKNISNKQEIEELIEEIRKSLVINDYQTRLLKERLSKTASDNELLAFFARNKDKFNLNDNIVKGLYLKVPRESSQLDNFRKWYKQDNDASRASIEENMLQNAIGYEYFYNHWVNFNDVMDNIPEVLKDSEYFLKNHKTLETKDSSFVYLLYIKEYKTTGSEAPFEYLKEYLIDAYLEEKREEFIKELQTDLYNKALADKNIKYHLK